jgi:hypothetical protein
MRICCCTFARDKRVNEDLNSHDCSPGQKGLSTGMLWWASKWPVGELANDELRKCKLSAEPGPVQLPSNKSA